MNGFEEESFKETVPATSLVSALILLSIILNRAKEGYSLGKNIRKEKHLLFVDSLKPYGKDKNQLDCLVETIRIFNSSIWMTFSMRRYAVMEREFYIKWVYYKNC